MDHDVHVDELLSSYLVDDISPDERAAVERQLSHDRLFRERLTELRDLVALLQLGERPVTPEMLADFERRIDRHLRAPAGRAVFAHLVSCSVANDLTDTERSVLEIYLTRNPSARNEVVSLRAMSRFLKSAERRPSEQAARKLAERLCAKLPAAALTPVLPQPAETVEMQLQIPESAQKPTVRIFVARENPWPRRVRRAAAAIAALIAISAGVLFGLRALLRPAAETPVAVTPEQSNPTPTRDGAGSIPQPNDTPIEKAAQSERELADGNLPNPIVRPQPDSPSVPPIVENRLPDTGLTPSGKVGDVTARLNKPKQHGPNIEDRTNTVHPRPSDSKDKELADEYKPTPEPPFPPSQQVDPDHKSQPNTNGGGAGGGVVPNPQAQNNPQPQPPNNPAAQPPDAPLNDGMIVAVVRDGAVQATTAAGPQTVQTGQQLPSGTDITTDTSRVAFKLPGDGRLWVNRHSSLNVQFNGPNTTVHLNSGQISYRAPLGGSLTVNQPSGVQVADANGTIDILSDPASKTMVASVIDHTAKVVHKSKAATTLKKQTKATVKLDADDTQVTAFANRPDQWHADLVVDGDNPDGSPLIPFSNPPANSKEKSSGRSKTHK